MIGQAQLEAAAEWAYSSVVEHCVDIAGVASSILATPTICSFAMSSFIFDPSGIDTIALAYCRFGGVLVLPCIGRPR